MKTLISIALIFFVAAQINSQTLKPYILASTVSDDISAVESNVKASLEKSGFQILGSYAPNVEPDRIVIAISSNELEKAVQKTGGLTGFAVALRVSLTASESGVEIAYTSPEYWCNAYFRDQYPAIAAEVVTTSERLKSAFSDLGNTDFAPFGSKKGMSESKLRKYHYMMAMPYFDDTELLASYSSYDQAVSQLDNIFASGAPGVELVYSKSIDDKELKLYGVALTGDDGEAQFMPIVDISSPKHTAFLPYEILVVGKEVHMLHGKFRIALSFPDLTMGTFMKISSTPKDIRNTLSTALANE